MTLSWPEIDAPGSCRSSAILTSPDRYWPYLQSVWKILSPEFRAFALRRQRWYMNLKVSANYKNATPPQDGWGISWSGHEKYLRLTPPGSQHEKTKANNVLEFDLSGDSRLLWADAQIILSDTTRLMAVFESNHSDHGKARVLQSNTEIFGLLDGEYSHFIWASANTGVVRRISPPILLATDFIVCRWLQDFKPAQVLSIPLINHVELQSSYFSDLLYHCARAGVFPRKLAQAAWFDATPGSVGWRRALASWAEFLAMLCKAKVTAYILLTDPSSSQVLMKIGSPKAYTGKPCRSSSFGANELTRLEETISELDDDYFSTPFPPLSI